MIHVPAKHIRDEMLSLQQLTRASLAYAGAEQLQPTLVVKAKSLSLKYLFRASKVRLLVAQTRERHLVYGICIDDDPKAPCVLWSVVERKDEMESIQRILAGEQFMLAMFNEAVVNTCSGLLIVESSTKEIGREEFANARLAGKSKFKRIETEVESLFEKWHSEGSGFYAFSSKGQLTWSPNKSVYITNQLQASQLELVHANEGGQQEQLAAWITDSLHPGGVYQNPYAQENPPRELCDLLLTHNFGTVLFESKALAILTRPDLPIREKLKSMLKKHIEKALRQLSGACKNLRIGTPVLTHDGRVITTERTFPPHCIVVVPDLSLLDHSKDIFADMFEFAKKTKGFLNILDPSQLFNLMMDSNNLSSRSKTVTPLMAFDYLLIERFKSVIKARDPGLVMLCRFK